MNGVDRVKAICKERKIPISKLERDLGYANGYIGQLRKGVFPSDRLMEIAEYLSVSHTYILTGEQTEKAPTDNGERDILDDVDVAFYGDFKELNEEQKETVRDMVRLMRQRKEKRSQ